jgi:hypothetical protein
MPRHAEVVLAALLLVAIAAPAASAAPGDRAGAAAIRQAAYDRLNDKIARSGARLRELGVSKRVVGWWTGDTLLGEVDPPDALIPEDS